MVLGGGQRRAGRELAGVVPKSKGQEAYSIADKALEPEPDKKRFKLQLCH